ncbi:phosphatase PAP2 family protein [Commensalibacter oyaizuii]|uniref:Phosphatase PAP2 family protein n=1 Tax=Commensalibacter oyaizuii TaxID=3043873 RepID=A0ABT6Q2U8_9PROT|nr:phosphatase PAP2 family protein [Commensalibacter sp. TBRC 16381]MDI2091453.1 phosphatase PAP2 family protein [Commensalibacter sp. TBRC 16381]
MFLNAKILFDSGLILFCVAAFIFAFTTWDQSLSHVLILSRTDFIVPIVKIISKTGSFVCITSAALILGTWLWLKKRIYDAIWVIVAMGSCRIVFAGLKLIVDRARPVFDEPLTHAITASFPSGHAVNSFMFLMVCYVILRYRASILYLTLLWGLLIGWSRLALGAHWFSDVLAGWGCALMWFVILAQIKDSSRLQQWCNQRFLNK